MARAGSGAAGRVADALPRGVSGHAKRAAALPDARGPPAACLHLWQAGGRDRASDQGVAVLVRGGGGGGSRRVRRELQRGVRRAGQVAGVPGRLHRLLAEAASQPAARGLLVVGTGRLQGGARDSRAAGGQQRGGAAGGTRLVRLVRQGDHLDRPAVPRPLLRPQVRGGGRPLLVAPDGARHWPARARACRPAVRRAGSARRERVRRGAARPVRRRRRGGARLPPAAGVAAAGGGRDAAPGGGAAPGAAERDARGAA
mmetsp:Transcript_27175/g.46553  ORF Transcript_27175/g.46553 Transcript_27175/m.46553 type:complete len:257 (-) Transcript_27175:378-1148(-)